MDRYLETVDRAISVAVISTAEQNNRQMVIYENTELALALWYKGRLLCSTTSYIREFLLDVHLLLGSLDIELCACVWA